MTALTNPNDPATPRQTFMIHCLGGGDVRNQGLTKQQASDRINVLKAAKEAAKAARPKIRAIPQSPFEGIMAEATQAANRAGDEWMAKALARGPAYVVKQRGVVVGTMLDVCGFAGIELSDKRTAFAKWHKGKYGAAYQVRLGHKYTGRQELGLKEVCSRAAMAVFNHYGIKGLRSYSRID